MKSRGIKILALIAILLISVSSFAVKGKKLSIDERATLQMQKIHQVCNLTLQQQTQVKQVFVYKLTSRQALDAQKENKTKSLKSASPKKGDRAKRSTSLKANKQHTDNSMRSILTPQQVALWSAHKKSLR
jgi:hypothetical protein